MTRIKCATVALARKSDSIVIIRGKKTGRIGFRPFDEDGAFDDPVDSERVVELPEPMTPTEFHDYVISLDDPHSDLAHAVNAVADEHGIETCWFGRVSEA